MFHLELLNLLALSQEKIRLPANFSFVRWSSEGDTGAEGSFNPGTGVAATDCVIKEAGEGDPGGDVQGGATGHSASPGSSGGANPCRHAGMQARPGVPKGSHILRPFVDSPPF